ncbi:hypothetical protein J4456_02460 [Candidatus Pacearchaeota archaeon]|nr:hypothetical protein [Candidatus Pacearchaeota archaeon]
MKIALSIPTGRPRVKHVVKSFLENAVQYGYDLKNFSVYLSIDTTFKKTRVADFILHSELENKLGKIEYISPKRRKDIGEDLVNLGVETNLAISLFAGRGYSRLRNSSLLLALRDNNDVAICIDDDEVPYIPIESQEGKIRWENLDFFTPHLEALKSTDITRGPYMGYLSPIPSDLEEEISPLVRRRLGEALQIGNEIVTVNSFFNLMENIIYLPEREILNPHRPYIVANSKYGKTILSGNMGINLHSIREGKLPIFYTPPSARGEDTFFGLQLKNNTVIEVPSYIFHDPFGLYPHLLKGKFPHKLKNIPVNKTSINRFADAVIGWLKYAPLFVYMSSKTAAEREERIEDMIKKIVKPTQQLAELLHCPKLYFSKEILEDYHRNVVNHYYMLQKSQEVWKNKILPQYRGISA